MNLNDREKKTAAVVGVVVGLLVLYFLVSTLYLSPRSENSRKISQNKRTLSEQDDKLLKQRQVNLKLAELVDNGLSGDSTLTARLIYEKVSQIAQKDQIQITQWIGAQTGRNLNKSDFTEYRYEVTISKNANQVMIGRFLQDLEQANLPARIERLEIRSNKDGYNDLNTSVTIMGIVYTPKPPPKGTTASATPLATVANAARRVGTTRPGVTGVARSGGSNTQPGMNWVATPENPDPPLPDGQDMETRLKQRRLLQIESAEKAIANPTRGGA